ncbi:MAG: hypothetical protein HY557_08460 [Euryarchaeota archaeon]|nr:hypothetical protein [Euryarchaeota archaeon]
MKRVPDGNVAALAERILVAAIFLGGFLLAYLAVPFNPTIPGTSFQVRPEPLVLILALPVGRTALGGATAGMLVHNFAFRLGPEITPFFAIAQTATVLLAGAVGILVWRQFAPPVRGVVTPLAFVAVFVPILGFLSAAELQAIPAVEMGHIFEETFVPQLIVGPAALLLYDTRAKIVPMRWA